MNCPKCGGPAAAVIDSRPTKDGIRRRRKCPSCGERWTTYEVASGGKGDRVAVLRQATVRKLIDVSRQLASIVEAEVADEPDEPTLIPAALDSREADPTPAGSGLSCAVISVGEPARL